MYGSRTPLLKSFGRDAWPLNLGLYGSSAFGDMSSATVTLVISHSPNYVCCHIQALRGLSSLGDPLDGIVSLMRWTTTASAHNTRGHAPRKMAGSRSEGRPLTLQVSERASCPVVEGTSAVKPDADVLGKPRARIILRRGGRPYPCGPETVLRYLRGRTLKSSSA